jgi:hypothetical protein
MRGCWPVPCSWHAPALAGSGPAYDAALHAVFVGFVVATVFAHAPIVFPALMGVRIRYSPALYLPLALLHVSLALRLAGDLANVATWRAAGSIGNTAAIGLFALTMAAAVAAGRSGAAAPPPQVTDPSSLPRPGAS